MGKHVFVNLIKETGHFSLPYDTKVLKISQLYFAQIGSECYQFLTDLDKQPLFIFTPSIVDCSYNGKNDCGYIVNVDAVIYLDKKYSANTPIKYSINHSDGSIANLSGGEISIIFECNI